MRTKLGQAVFQDKQRSILDRIKSFLISGDKIIDLGSGTCMFTRDLMEDGFYVTPVDVKNRSYYPDITPLIYNGIKLPFKDNAFDTCLLIAVLHHTPNPEIVLKEAVRVSKKLIILEDIYTTIFNQYYAYIIDSILNKEFFGHPHSNKTDESWRRLFKKLELTLIENEYFTTWGFLRNAIYYLKK